MKCRLFAVFLALGSGLHAQGTFQWRLSSDAGVLRLHDSTSEKLAYFNPGLVLKYAERYGRHQFQFQARLRPEFYQGRSSRTLLNLGGTADYSSRMDALSWNAQVSEQRQHFYSSAIRFYINQLQATVSADWQINSQWVPRISAQVASQNVAGDVRSDYVTRSISALMNFFPLPNMVLSGGLYAEQFSIHIPQSSVPLTKNDGSGSGWTTGFEYDRNFTLRMNYRRVYRRSDDLDDRSVEQQFSFIAGKPITARLSAFFYLDLTKRHSDTQQTVPPALRINNGNYENRWYGKISYEYSESTEVYIKAGSVTYDWYHRSPLSGFQFSAGVRLQK